MITNMLAKTGPYAGLWAHLKSIDHALSRVLDKGRGGVLTELDKDRLQALSDLLNSALVSADEPTNLKNKFNFPTGTDRSEYGLALNLRNAIESNEIFRQWQEKARKPFKQDVERLIRAVDKCRTTSAQTLVADVPRLECETLRAIIETLLCDAEVTLQA